MPCILLCNSWHSLFGNWVESPKLEVIIALLINFIIFSNHPKGDSVEESIIEKIPLYKAGYNYVRLFCSYFMGERAHLLQYADVASELVPICFMGVYRVSFIVI